MMTQSLQDLAQAFESEVSKGYLLITVSALICAIGFSILIFTFLGFTALSVIESIGACLIVIVASIGLIQWRCQRNYRLILKKVIENQFTAEQFTEFILASPIQYELSSNWLKKRKKS